MTTHPLVLVQPRLPDGGLDALLALPLQPVINAFNGAHAHPEDPVGFPLAWAVAAPNSPAFLASLGKPLAIARDLESEPGVWWLAGPEGHPQFVIFSDAHRKNHWKGGQLCLVHKGGPGFHPRHPGLVALCESLAQVWGDPGPVGALADPYRSLDSIFRSLEWFEQRAREDGPVTWPRAGEAMAPPRRPVR